jgi:Cu(I)-responsive transcriptional regulator
MNIGEAAVASGVSAKMIRHYESIGLIRAPLRTESNYRVYSTEDVHVLRFIKRARTLGFSIEKTAMLLGLWQDRSRASADVKQLALTHIAELEERILELQEMVSTLKHLAECCSGDDRPDCPILNDLAQMALLPDETRAPRRKAAASHH